MEMYSTKNLSQTIQNLLKLYHHLILYDIMEVLQISDTISQSKAEELISMLKKSAKKHYVRRCVMQITQIKEDISISYISALCAYAGIAYEIVRHDADSTDGI